MKEQKRDSAATAAALRVAWMDRQRECTDARKLLDQLETSLREHTGELYKAELRTSSLASEVRVVVRNGTSTCLQTNPAILAEELIAGKSLAAIIEHEQELLKPRYARMRFAFGAPNVVASEDAPLIFMRWDAARAACIVLKEAIRFQKSAILAVTKVSMQKFSKTVAPARRETARQVLAALAELRRLVESDQALANGLLPDEIELIRPRPFPTRIASSEVVQWLLDAEKEKMIDPSELSGLEPEPVPQSDANAEPEKENWLAQI